MTEIQPLVEMRGVHKNYGTLQVLSGIDLEMRPGDRLVVIGPSGGGKSTLLRIMMGLEDIRRGEIDLLGKRYITGHEQSGKTRIDSTLRKQVGMVFQHYTLFPHLTIISNLTLAAIKTRGMAKPAALDKGMQLLKRLGLESKAQSYPSQLSGGQKQRVAIARALMLDPRLMLFDEVTSALDPELVAEVLGVIQSLAREGMTMILVTHEIAFAREVADKVVFMRDGVVVESGPPSQVIDNPEQEATRSFLGRILGRAQVA